MDNAIRYKKEHPDLPYSKVARKFKVNYRVLIDRYTGKHRPIKESRNRKVSLAQEDALIDRIAMYAELGLCMTPGQIKDLAERLIGESLGINWASKFIKRNADRIKSGHLGYLDAYRVTADTRETREAFYALVKSRPLSGSC